MQGMESALQRIGQGPQGDVMGGPGVSKDDPDLVAYWTFDEGKGYVVHDVTKRGHDLYLTNEPHWEVRLLPSLPPPTGQLRRGTVESFVVVQNPSGIASNVPCLGPSPCI